MKKILLSAFLVSSLLVSCAHQGHKGSDCGCGGKTDKACDCSEKNADGKCQCKVKKDEVKKEEKKKK